LGAIFAGCGVWLGLSSRAWLA